MPVQLLKYLAKYKTVPKPAAEQIIELTKPWLALKEFNKGTPADRLPDHYKKFYWQWKHGEKLAVHHIPEKGNFKLGADGETV